MVKYLEWARLTFASLFMAYIFIYFFFCIHTENWIDLIKILLFTSLGAASYHIIGILLSAWKRSIKGVQDER
jgi:hypothetical protein